MFTREASALDLFTDSVRSLGDATLCGIMEFDRRLDPCRLEGAARACLLAHPILRSRLVRGNGPARWELTEDTCHPAVTAEECGQDYRPRVTGPVDPYGSLQVRVRLLRRPSGDVIVINLAHAAADASGLHTLMAQLLREYACPGSILPAKGGIPERDTHWTRSFCQKRRTGAEMQVIDPLWPDPFGTADGPTLFHRETVGPADITKIRRYAKDLGGNLNDTLLASYFITMSDLTGHNGPMQVFFPVNMRRYLPEGSRVMSNQATNVSITVGRMEGEGMDTILPRVIAQTNQLKEGGIGIAEQVDMDEACDPEGRHVHEMVQQMVSLQKQGLADIFISNPGTITLPDMAGLTGAYVCYPGGYMPATCFITSTFRDQMTITLGYQDGKKTREGTRRAMDLFLSHLCSLAR